MKSSACLPAVYPDSVQAIRRLTSAIKGFSFASMNFTLALAIGFSVASIPGPIIILITTETLRKGPKAGLLTMAAPVLMDALVMLPLGLLLQASVFSGGGGIFLGFLGGGFLCWLGFQAIRAGTTGVETDAMLPSVKDIPEIPPFFKGAMTQLTSPYPYLYWGTVGASFIRQSFESGGLWSAALFPLGFWIGASAFGVLVILVAGHGKKLLPPHLEPYLHRLSGGLLVACGVFLAIKAWLAFIRG